MKKYYKYFLPLLIIPVFIAIPSLLADYDTVDLCKGRLERQIYLLIDQIPEDEFVKNEINDRCIRRIEPGLTPLPQDLTSISQIAQKDWESYSAWVITSMYVINNRVELDKADNAVEEDEVIKTIETVEKALNASNPIPSQYAGYKNEYSEFTYITTAYDYITYDHSEFKKFANNILVSYKDYLEKIRNLCINGQYNVASQTCKCNTGYYWNSAEGYCSNLQRLCETLHGPYAKANRFKGICECKEGYEFNVRNNCVPEKSDGKEEMKEVDKVVSQIIKSESIFADIDENHYQAKAIRYLKNKEIIKGYSDGTFKPYNTVNRAELMKILIGDTLPTGIYENCFKDVQQEWFAPYICYAKTQGWVKGYPDGTFKPSQTVNRAEAIKMAIGVFNIELPITVDSNPYPDVDKNAWFASYLQVAKKANLILLVTEYYQPADGMERGDISEIIYRLLTLKELQVETYDESLDSQMLTE